MKRIPIVLLLALCFLLGYAAAPQAVAETTPISSPSATPAGAPTPTPVPIHMGGADVPWDAAVVDLSAIRPEDIPAAMDALEALPYVREVKLTDQDDASPWSIQQAWALMERWPQLQVEYTATAFGVSFSLTDEVVSFSSIDFSDRVEELKALLPCMARVGRLDMENCHIPDEQMADLRAEFPAPKIVWRVFVGKYSCRTDAIMIRFSESNDALRLYDKDVHPLIYCNEIKYLDLGHNRLSSAYFTAYMPDLEVCILAVERYLDDISALANCPKLEFLEIFSNKITDTDLSVLTECKNLRHLNISCNNITDITPLFSLDLERLWMTQSNVSLAQIQEFREKFPNCEVNNTAPDPAAGTWRYKGNAMAPRYALLRQQFCYDHMEINSYSEPPPFH